MTIVFRLLQKVAYFEVFNFKSDTCSAKPWRSGTCSAKPWRSAIINSTMNSVDFMEDNEFHIKSRRLLGEPTTPSMVRFLLRSGVVKNEKQALLVLIGVVIAVLALTFYLGNILLGSPDGPTYIEDRFGNRYTPEEYVGYINKGIDPLSPNFKP
jgi:hypothetical protein